MELVNATRKAIDSGAGPADPAVREAAEAVAIMLSAGRALHGRGHVGCSSDTSRPSLGPAGRRSTRRCSSRESVTCVVQVGGKKRALLDVSPDIESAELEALALAVPEIAAILDGRSPTKVIVRPPRVVNIVV